VRYGLRTRTGALSSFNFNARSPIDDDAVAFFNATGLTDETQKVAINYLVSNLKGFSLWTKMKAIYPFVGGTAAFHKWNLKDPRDLDAAFRIVWSGTVIHASTGVTSNGTNGYGDTFFIPVDNLSSGDTHMTYYSRTQNANGNFVEMGSFQATGRNFLVIIKGFGDTGYYSGTSPYPTVNSNTTTRGYFVGTLTGSIYKTKLDNVDLASISPTATTLPNRKVFILANNEGLPLYFSTRECALATIGTGLTDTDATNLRLVVQEYQTILGRNV